MSSDRETDHIALEARAADLEHIEAIRHLRTQTGLSLRNGMALAERIAKERPGSRLAESIRRWDAFQRRLGWISAVIFIGVLIIAWIARHRAG